MAASRTSNTLRFDDGAVQFRLRLAASLLSNRTVLIRNIRADDTESPGLRPYEVSFLRLLDSITNGSKLEINATGTQLRFVPGILTGGSHDHACPVLDEGDEEEDLNARVRSIGWFLEGILPIAPFGKDPLTINFTGLTDGTCEQDPSADYWQAIAIPILAKFGVGTGAEEDFMAQAGPSIHIHQRAAAPLGQTGRVTFYSPVVRTYLKPIDWTDEGKIKRIRGQAISCKLTSSSATARVSYAAKGVLHRLLPDVWIHTNVHTIKQHQCGPSPSLSLLLTTESTTGVKLASEVCLATSTTNVATTADGRRETPEALGQRGATRLFDVVRQGGVVDQTAQAVVLLWMCLSPEDDVSRVRLGTLSAYTIAALRLYKAALGVECKIVPDLETKTVLVSCVGLGYRNLARAST